MQHFTRTRTRTSARAALLVLAGSLAAGSACRSDDEKKKEENKPTETAAAEPKAAAAPAKKPKVVPKRLEWDDPKVWKKVPASGMRLASYQIPPVAGDKEIAELNVFSLGGDVESNIQRWIDEFKGFDPTTLSRTDRVVNDLSESVVEIPKGTFSGGMGEGGESPSFGLLGAIVTTPENLLYFFKLTGPSATIQASRKPFYELLDSVRMEGGSAAPASAKTIKSVGRAPNAAAAAGTAGTGSQAAPAASAAPAPGKH